MEQVRNSTQNVKKINVVGIITALFWVFGVR